MFEAIPCALLTDVLVFTREKLALSAYVRNSGEALATDGIDGSIGVVTVDKFIGSHIRIGASPEKDVCTTGYAECC